MVPADDGGQQRRASATGRPSSLPSSSAKQQNVSRAREVDQRITGVGTSQSICGLAALV